MHALADADLDLLLLIRRFEETLLDLFASQEISGTTHTCLGQEYVPVALAPLIRHDLVFSSHRGHGHYLAHCGDAAGLLAEIMGREGGPCRGVGGSQHLLREGFLSTGVQGESLPLAVGAALHFKQRSPGRIAVAYIGDGTWGEGSVYEALNMAALWQLPVLVVVENNGIAQTTATSRQMAGTVGGRAAAFGVAHRRLTGYDVSAIRAELAPLVERIRADNLPLVVEFDTVRLGPHSKGDDTRPVEEIAALRERDWCAAYARQDPVRFAAADRRQRRHVADVVEDVRRRQLSTWKVV